MPVTMKVERVDRLKRRLDRMPAVTVDAASEAMLKIGRETADAARRLAPKDTGAGAATIDAAIGDHRLEVIVGTPDVGLFMQEHGTVHHEAQPSLRPAYRTMRRRVGGRMKSAFRRAAKKALQ